MDLPSGANCGSETRATFEKSSSVKRRAPCCAGRATPTAKKARTVNSSFRMGNSRENPSTGPPRPSLHPERPHRIDSRRPPRREPRRADGDEQERAGHGEIEKGARRVDLEERLLHQPGHGQPAGDPEHDARQRETRAVAE